MPWPNILSTPHARRWTGWDSFLSPVSCTQDHCPPSSSHLAQHFNIYLCSPCFLMHLYCTRIDFQEIHLGLFFFLLAHTWVGKVHISVEITFSELFLQVCQIYKRHDRKDMFLDLDFLLSLFLLSFVMSGSPRTGFIWLGFWFLSHFSAQVVLLCIKAPHQILFHFLHLSFRIK